MIVAEIPLESCMFAKLPIPSGRGRVRYQELLYAFEALLPLPIEECQIVFANATDGVVACACRKTDLESVRSTAEAAVPRELPAWISSQDPELVCRQLNLLSGDLGSMIRERRHGRTVLIASVVLLAAAGIFASSAFHRASKLEHQVDEVRGDIDALYRIVLPKVDGLAQPDSIRFATIMNQLNASRTGVVHSAEHELIEELASLVGEWPAEAMAQVRSLRIDQSGGQLEITLPDNQHASMLLSHITNMQGWEVQSRSTRPAANGSMELSVQIRRVSSEASDA